MARILVTGGAGFIGSHVAQAYLAKGHEVTVVDDLSGGRRSLVPPGARLEQTDIRSPELEGVFQRVRPEVVNHLAAQVSVVRSSREPQMDAAINVGGSVNVLEMAAKHGVGRFIFSSTGGALYGEPKRLPCDESHPVLPMSPYGVAKYCVEQYVGYYSRLRGLPSVILRYANVYGPGQDPHGEAGVVAIFSKKMLNGEPIAIFGDGEQTRDFVYVDDVAQANVLALTKGEGGAFNIGTGAGTAVNYLCSVLATLTGYKLTPTHRAPNAGEVRQIYLDASKAMKDLGWRPTISIDEGLRRTVQALQEEG